MRCPVFPTLSRWLTASLFLATSLTAQYQKPPQAIQDVLNAPSTPLVSVNPTHSHVMFLEFVRNPSIADLAKPMLRIAGLRIDPANSGPHLTSYATKAWLKRVDTGAQTNLATPAGARLSGLSWSPDGRYFAVLNHQETAVELWVGETATGKLKKIEKIAVNGSLGGGAQGASGASGPFDWMPDSRTLLVRTVPAGRGPLPAKPETPIGPAIEESVGRAGATRTYQDMLKNPYDEQLFEYFVQSQLVSVNVASGAVTPIGKPSPILSQDPSPDGQHLLVTTVHRPYSYVLPYNRFPRNVEVWSKTGQMEHTVAKLGLQDRIPIDGVATGPRNIGWQAVGNATLQWVEAMDGGNPKEKVPHRDRVLLLAAPFQGEAKELTKVEERIAGGLLWSSRGNQYIVGDYERDKKRLRTFLRNTDGSSKVIFERNIQDRYANPGAILSKVLPNGQRVLWESGGYWFLDGDGSTPNGDLPFLDRFDPVTGKKERLFHCDPEHYETVVALLSDDGSRFLTRRESPTEPPNFFIRDTQGNLKAFTDFPDPAPQLRGIKKQLVKYKRPDGVDLSFTLYLPPGYKEGTRLPTVVWAYPVEFNDASTAGQISGSTKRFTTISGYSHLFFLLQGYAILDGATIPIIGSPEEANNTYVEQLVASAKAAIDKGAEMGVTDPERVGVGGHSYGAFMTANLLAHSDLFRAGIARSGAYNRTLTPFGFQSERRTFWEAQDIYMRMSPFMHADKIKEPILLIHGEADNNQGTFPIQSERMYQAIRGNGGTVRYVTLPFESHGYSAKESVEHTLYEMISWFDRYVKNAPKKLSQAEE
ncbi:MAG: prolyl oligopeptidase family serine peptidase [Bryobacter sp.]|nr:prolyl oligopeptidase family serine peptidase [Bryobacter sp.]